MNRAWQQAMPFILSPICKRKPASTLLRIINEQVIILTEFCA